MRLPPEVSGHQGGLLGATGSKIETVGLSHHLWVMQVMES